MRSSITTVTIRVDYELAARRRDELNVLVSFDPSDVNRRILLVRECASLDERFEVGFELESRIILEPFDGDVCFVGSAGEVEADRVGEWLDLQFDSFRFDFGGRVNSRIIDDDAS